MSFFSSDAFLGVVADVFHPGAPHRFEPVAVGDEIYRLLVVRDHRVVSHVPFWDYVEPQGATGVAPRHTLPCLPHAVRGAAITEAWQVHASESVYTPAPFVDWARFASWGEFLSYAGNRSPFAFKLSERKSRKITRELGPLSIRATDVDEALLVLGMTWKSAQYRRTSLWDVFAVEKNRLMFLELYRRGLLDLRVLDAGGRPIAMHAGVVHAGRYYYWLPAHDPDASAYSPGTLLLEHLLESAYQHGWEFDFLLGGEPYKLAYATHVRLVGLAGQVPLPQRAYRALRSAAVAQVRKNARVYGLLQASKRKFKERALVG
jgi:hypothetical protein